MHRKRLLLLALLLVPLLALGVYWWRSAETLYYQPGQQIYKVVRWEVHRGTNLTFASDYKIKQWTRRQLDKVGIRLKGSRFDPPFNPSSFSHPPHVIKLLCEADSPPASPPPPNRIDVAGDGTRPKLFRGMMQGPPGHVWFFWAYDSSLQPEVVLSPEPRSTPTNPAPLYFRIVSKPKGKELLSLPFTH